jgi:REP element-mobilizing transposase RayT
VMNRGVAKRPLYEDRSDARFFLARLARQIRAGRIEVHAYCLMTTHFHLLVRSPVGALSEAMRRVQNEHSRRFNRRRKRDGTLIRGRFTSKPVHSLCYRRTLVSYIDANPVGAGVVRVSGEHRLGSARAYLHGTGPRWLSRGWVESEVCRRTGVGEYSAAAYRRSFGTGKAPETAELVAARIASTAVNDPLDDLIGAAPARVREWMRRKARLADGCRIGLPVCSARAVRTALSVYVRRQRPWIVEDGGSIRHGPELLRPGLLRDLCGLSWHGISSVEGRTEPVLRRRVGHHRRLLLTNADYARRAAEVAKAALDRLGTRSGGV